MATQVQDDAITDAIVTAFGGDVAKFAAFLTRAALETELAEIDSDIRNLQDVAEDAASGYVAGQAELAVLRATKVAEIDALS